MNIDYMEAMDDAELGRQVKDAARRFAAEEVNTFAIQRMAALLLVCETFPANSTDSEVRLENVTYRGESKGDWVVTARQVKP